MPSGGPSLTTDQLAALVELAHQGSLRAAADELHISQQGVRNRLLALEGRLKVELYRKCRGLRRSAPLTPAGQRFLPRAVALLRDARELADTFAQSGEEEIHIVASQYLTLYVLIDAIRRFHAEVSRVRVRLSTRTEQEIEEVLLRDPRVTLGVAAPYEPATELQYQHMFAITWSLIAPRRHPLLRRRRVGLRDLADQPLILFERGSTGRQHILDAFHAQGLAPRVEMETTTTEIIVRMVEAGLGVSIVPLLPNGAVTRGRRVGVRPLRAAIRPIMSGVLTRRGERISPVVGQLIERIGAAAARSSR